MQNKTREQIQRLQYQIDTLTRRYPDIAETLFPRLLADRRRKILKLKKLLIQ